MATLLGLGVGHASAQLQTAVCSNTPAESERIECIEDVRSTADIQLDPEGPR